MKFISMLQQSFSRTKNSIIDFFKYPGVRTALFSIPVLGVFMSLWKENLLKCPGGMYVISTIAFLAHSQIVSTRKVAQLESDSRTQVQKIEELKTLIEAGFRRNDAAHEKTKDKVVSLNQRVGELQQKLKKEFPDTVVPALKKRPDSAPLLLMNMHHQKTTSAKVAGKQSGAKGGVSTVGKKLKKGN